MESCKGLIRQQESKQVIYSFERGKYQGVDGIQGALSIKTTFQNTFNRSFVAKDKIYVFRFTGERRTTKDPQSGSEELTLKKNLRLHKFQ